jgi:hypothetical protein
VLPPKLLDLGIQRPADLLSNMLSGLRRPLRQRIPLRMQHRRNQLTPPSLPIHPLSRRHLLQPIPHHSLRQLIKMHHRRPLTKAIDQVPPINTRTGRLLNQTIRRRIRARLLPIVESET